MGNLQQTRKTTRSGRARRRRRSRHRPRLPFRLGRSRSRARRRRNSRRRSLPGIRVRAAINRGVVSRRVDAGLPCVSAGVNDRGESGGVRGRVGHGEGGDDAGGSVGGEVGDGSAVDGGGGPGVVDELLGSLDRSGARASRHPGRESLGWVGREGDALVAEDCWAGTGRETRVAWHEAVLEGESVTSRRRSANVAERSQGATHW